MITKIRDFVYDADDVNKSKYRRRLINLVVKLITVAIILSVFVDKQWGYRMTILALSAIVYESINYSLFPESHYN